MIEASGFLNILKPPGMSSHDVVSAVRRTLHIKRVGHAGTLDPAAAGVLPVAVGRAARLIEYLAMSDKSYRAEVLLGLATDSGDAMGSLTERMPDARMPSESRLKEVLAGFLGSIEQRPPKHSAIKIHGRKACDMARQDMEVEIPLRQVEIHRLELLASNGEERKFLLDVDCSKGTYIRSLCMDIGKALGIPAVLSFLLRRRVGDFTLSGACTLEELAEKGIEALLSPEQCLSHISRYELPEHRAKPFCNGLPTGEQRKEDLPSLLRVYSGEQFLGMGRYDALEKAVYPVKVYRESI